MRKFIAKHFDGATPLQALLGCAAIAAAFLAIIAAM